MLARLQWIMNRIEDTVLVLVLGGMILFAVLQIGLRNFFGTGILWSDPLVRVLVLWAGLIGAMVAARLDRHIVISALAHFMNPHWKLGARVVTDLAAAVVCLVVTWVSLRFVFADYVARTMAFAAVPAWVCEIIIPIAFLVMGVRYALHSLDSARELLGRAA
jgi:TRAP-type C4-dicarboxylate transport system permease small subunit